MSEPARIAFQNSQTAAMVVEAMGMQAENQRWVVLGQPPAYTEAAFKNLIAHYGCDYNSVMSYLFHY